MNSQQLIYEHLNGDFLAGDAFLCLQLAVSLQDHDKAVQAGMRCMDLARHLEAKQKKDPARKPAAETEVPADWPEAVKEIRSGNPNSAMVAEVHAREYQWGGLKWKIEGDHVYAFNRRNSVWEQSTMLPEHLRKECEP